MKKRFFSTLIILLCSCFIISYLVADTRYSDSLVHYVSKLKNKIPKRYTAPTESQAIIFRETVGFILQSQFAGATSHANAVGYNVKGFTDKNGLTYYILESKYPKSRPWGTYIFYLETDAVNRVIEVPHPVSEKNVAKIATELFVDTSSETYKPKALFISGSSRSTGDVATLPLSFFQIAHEAATDSSTDVVQIHGFNVQEYPQIVMTSGISSVPAAMDKYVEQLVTKFEVGIFNGVDYSRVAATTNVQAVYTNSIGGNFIGIFLNRQVHYSKRLRDRFIDLTEEAISETTTTTTS